MAELQGGNICPVESSIRHRGLDPLKEAPTRLLASNLAEEGRRR